MVDETRKESTVDVSSVKRKTDWQERERENTWYNVVARQGNTQVVSLTELSRHAIRSNVSEKIIMHIINIFIRDNSELLETSFDD